MILAFIFLYKLGDSMCTALATPFYLDMGFAKSQIGIVAKNAGLWPAVIGGLIGGLWGMGGETGHQSCVVAVRRGATGVHFRLCLAGVARSSCCGGGRWNWRNWHW
jgi:hypothetical protein